MERRGPGIDSGDRLDLTGIMGPVGPARDSSSSTVGRDLLWPSKTTTSEITISREQIISRTIVCDKGSFGPTLGASDILYRLVGISGYLQRAAETYRHTVNESITFEQIQMIISTISHSQSPRPIPHTFTNTYKPM